MKQCYIPKNFKPETMVLIARINSIVDEYQAAGYVLTVRQLYYQLVARDIIPNTLQEYKRAAGIINDAKHAGLVDWDMIEDRTPSAILQVCADTYHMDMWENQPSRVFAIIEKEALVGVLERACHEYDVPLLAARGYPSGSVLREFALEDMRPALKAGQKAIVLHLGDHDPSGIDMTRDLRERLSMYTGADVQLIRLALNMDQVEEEDPPENPAKVTDSRFEAYAEQYGTSSWELDALSPQYLDDLVTRNIVHHIDDGAWDDRKDEIGEIRERLQKVADDFEAE